MDVWVVDREKLLDSSASMPRYESIADGVRSAIQSGSLSAGSRMPTFRDFAQYLGVSVTTVASAYNLLQRQGWIHSAVGRGTFVSTQRDAPGAKGKSRSFKARAEQREWRPQWRRRALIASSSRLKASFPQALDCTSGRPNRDLLPLDLVQRALVETASSLVPENLQYSGPEPLDSLVEALVPILRSDGVPAEASNLLIGSCAQQFLVLSFEVLRAKFSEVVLAAEQPGYPTILDTCDRLGIRLLGIDIDEEGPLLNSVERAFEGGANVILLTPRAQNPTGVSWSKERADGLADLLAVHHDIVLIEDDQIADATSSPCWSMSAHERLADRTIYVRSFSKTIAPDLRIATAVTRPPLNRMLMEAKNLADGWTSRITQRALCRILTYPELRPRLGDVADKYKQARESLTAAIDRELSFYGGRVWRSEDGVNVWIEVPVGSDCNDVAEGAAARGVLVAPGEPFFLAPGLRRHVRLNAGRVAPREAELVAAALSQAIQESMHTSASVFHV